MRIVHCTPFAVPCNILFYINIYIFFLKSSQLGHERHTRRIPGNMERRFLNIYTLQCLVYHSISPVSITVPALQFWTFPGPVIWIQQLTRNIHSCIGCSIVASLVILLVLCLHSSNLICSDVVSLRGKDDHFSRFELIWTNLGSQFVVLSHQRLKLLITATYWPRFFFHISRE